MISLQYPNKTYLVPLVCKIAFVPTAFAMIAVQVQVQNKASKQLPKQQKFVAIDSFRQKQKKGGYHKQSILKEPVCPPALLFPPQPQLIPKERK